jgi:hypothetical protein
MGTDGPADDRTDNSSIEEAVTSNRLEGLEPTAEFVADARLVVSGDLDDDDLVARALARRCR